MPKNLRKNYQMTYWPASSLVADLKQRGFLESTRVVWAGEIGRTPFVEDNRLGDDSRSRDHHPSAFMIWMGTGVKPGQVFDRTDDLGLAPIEDKVHINDLPATILHLLVIDHKNLPVDTIAEISSSLRGRKHSLQNAILMRFLE